MGRVIGRDGDIYDQDTGKWVGVIDNKGQEQLVSGDTGLQLQTTSSAAAAANRITMQAAIDSGLFRSDQPGVFEIDSALIYGSNCRIGPHHPGFEIKMRANSNTSMLVPSSLADFQAGGSTVTLTWSSGTQFSVNKVAHGKQAGDAVYIWNGTGWDFIGAHLVETVTDADNFTIRLPETPSAAPSGTWKMITAVQNTDIEGGMWNYNNPASAGTALNAHAILVAFAANVHVKKGTQLKNVAKYCVEMCGTINCTASLHSPGTISDGVKIHGPAVNCHAFDVTGTFGDDIVSIHNYEWVGAFQPSQPSTGGRIYNCSARRIQGRTPVRLLSVYHADTIPMDRVYGEDIYGFATAGAVGITGQSQANGPLGTVHLNRFGGQGITAGDLNASVTKMKHLILEGWKHNPLANTTTGVINLDTTATIPLVTLLRPDFTAAGWLASGNGSPITVQGPQSHIVIREPLFNSASLATGSMLTLATATCDCKMVTIEDGDIPNASALVIVSPSLATAPIINIVNNDVNTTGGFFCLVAASGNCTIALSRNRLHNVDRGVVRFNATANVTVKSDGTNTFSGTSVIASYSAGTATLELDGFDLPFDPITGIASITISANNGQKIKSTRAGAVNLGPAIKQPGGWVALGTGASGVNTVIT